jgi:hypothetical protein
VVFHVDLVQLCRHSKEHSGPRPLFWNSRLIGIKGRLGGGLNDFGLYSDFMWV